MSKFSFVGLCLSLCFYSLKAQEARRYVEHVKGHQIVVSNKNPAIHIKVDTSLHYIGTIESNVDSTAKFQEFVFGNIENGHLGRTFIVHFEHFLTSNFLTFNYPRFRMAIIGKYEYLHQIWYLKDPEIFKIKELSALLNEKGLLVEPEWLMNRYVRVVDRNSKNELILFYLEPGSIVSSDIKEIGMGDPKQTTLDNWQLSLKLRANSLFRIISEN
jgi:hypothetical protein